MKNKILIVDDEISWLETHREIIDISYPEMFEFEFAASAKEAINKIKEFKPDLVITDLEMEKIENELCAGQYLIKNINNNYENIEIIIISGASDIDAIANNNQVKRFIPKWDLFNYPIALRLNLSEIFNVHTEIC